MHDSNKTRHVSVPKYVITCRFSKLLCPGALEVTLDDMDKTDLYQKKKKCDSWAECLRLTVHIWRAKIRSSNEKTALLGQKFDQPYREYSAVTVGAAAPSSFRDITNNNLINNLLQYWHVRIWSLYCGVLNSGVSERSAVCVTQFSVKSNHCYHNSLGSGNPLRPSDAYMRSNHYWLRLWLIAWSAPSRYQNQRLDIV